VESESDSTADTALHAVWAPAGASVGVTGAGVVLLALVRAGDFRWAASNSYMPLGLWVSMLGVQAYLPNPSGFQACMTGLCTAWGPPVNGLSHHDSHRCTVCCCAVCEAYILCHLCGVATACIASCSVYRMPDSCPVEIWVTSAKVALVVCDQGDVRPLVLQLVLNKYWIQWSDG